MVAVWSWYSFWMILHVLTAIIAFGPALALPLLGRYAQTHPAAAATIADLGHLVEQRLVAPVSLLVGLTGVALIFAVPPWRDGPIDLWGTPWLVASVVWFVAALVFSTLFQSPNSARFARAVAGGARARDGRVRRTAPRGGDALEASAGRGRAADHLDDRDPRAHGVAAGRLTRSLPRPGDRPDGRSP